MPDDLRTRIARVLFALNAGEDWNMEPLAWEEAQESFRECWRRRADAVIHELNMVKEDGECSYCHAQLPGCRYICDWKTDE